MKNITCNKCGKEKLSKEFYPTHGRTCKECCRQRARQKTADMGMSLCKANRIKAIGILGAKCCYCGYDADIRALQIDHIYEDGNIERYTMYSGARGGNKYKRPGGNYLASKNILAGNTEGYQVLCANCNTIKRAESRLQKGPLGKRWGS